VFKGTPPLKPLDCKSVSNRLGARIRRAWADHAGGTRWRSCAWIRLALSDIIEMSLCYRSQTVHLFVCGSCRLFQGNKKPCLRFVSRVREKFLSSSEPAYTGSIQFAFDTLP
jgi:hypothetical protein